MITKVASNVGIIILRNGLIAEKELRIVENKSKDCQCSAHKFGGDEVSDFI